MAKMKAVVKTKKAPDSTELQELDIPAVSPEEVLIKVYAAGVCGTDLGIYHDKPGQIYYPPVILGHEFSGTIVKLGKSVSGWKIDDEVVAEPQTKACGICPYCRRGEIGMCPNKRSPGWGTNGGMAEYIVMPAKLLHKIPSGVSMEKAALTEPLAIAVHAMTENTTVEVGDVVVVLGPGPIGILSALLALECGAGTVVLVGTGSDEKYRLGAAKQMGIPFVLNIEKEDVNKKVVDLTEGMGADMVVDACGVESALNLGLKLLRKKGRFAGIGIASGKVNLDWNLAVMKNLSLYFQYSSTYTGWKRSLRLLASEKTPFGKVVSYKYPLEQWREAFTKSERGEALKVLLCP